MIKLSHKARASNPGPDPERLKQSLDGVLKNVHIATLVNGTDDEAKYGALQILNGIGMSQEEIKLRIGKLIGRDFLEEDKAKAIEFVDRMMGV